MKISKLNKILITIFVILTFVFAIYRIFPYFSNMIPLGYDPGVYRGIYNAYIKLYPLFHFGNLVPYWIVHEPLRGILSVFMSKIGISIDIFLTFGLGFFSILGGILTFFVIKKYNKRAALSAMMLFWTSIIQYHGFELCYFKQIIGVDLILILIYLWNKRKYWYSIPVLIILISLHRSTTLYLGVTSLVYIIMDFIVNKKLNKKLIYVWIISGVIGMSLYGPLFQRLIGDFFQPLVSTAGGSGIQGNFFSLKEFWWFVMFLIIPTIYGIYLKIKNKDFDLILSGITVGLLWTFLGLLNANRMQLFLDVFMILMIGYAIWYIIKKNKVWLRLLMYLFLSLQAIYYFGYVSNNNTPLISNGEFESITNLDKIIPEDGLVVVTDSKVSPRIVGYANRDWIGPGLSDINQRTHKERDQRRPMNGTGKCKMFEEYKDLNRPLYMWESKLLREENIEGGKCFKLIRENKYHKLYKINL